MLKTLSAIALTIALFSPATLSADYITGSLNGGSPVANVLIPDMNTATFLGVPSATGVTPGTGDLGTAVGLPITTLNIASNGPIVGFMTFGIFTIDVNSFSGPNVWTITSLPNGTDFLSMAFNGTARAVGYDDTPVTGAFSAQYSGGYDPDLIVAWSANLEAEEVPEPATLALVGLALVGAGLFHRRRQQQVV